MPLNATQQQALDLLRAGATGDGDWREVEWTAPVPSYDVPPAQVMGVKPHQFALLLADLEQQGLFQPYPAPDPESGETRRYAGKVKMDDAS